MDDAGMSRVLATGISTCYAQGRTALHLAWNSGLSFDVGVAMPGCTWQERNDAKVTSPFGDSRGRGHCLCALRYAARHRRVGDVPYLANCRALFERRRYG